MATLIVIEHRQGRRASLSKEYFPSDDEALNRALDLIREEVCAPQSWLRPVITYRIECDDDRTVLDDNAVRRLAVLERN